MVIDAHLHLPTHEGLVTLTDKKNRLLDDISRAGVSGAIVIADSETTSAIGTTKECVDLFKDTGNVFIMGGISPLIDFEARLIETNEYLSNEQIIACKLYPGHEAFYMNDSRLDRVFQLCLEHDVPLAVHTGWDEAHYNHPKYLAGIAKSYPALRIVVCHVYWPDIDLCYEMTVKHTNIFYDISSLAFHEEYHDQTRASLNRIARYCPERVIFGSDYSMCSIESHLDLVEKLDVNNAAKQLILHDNTVHLYKLNLT